MPDITRALSIRQPYAEKIMLGTKTVEYRSRPTNIRERIYIYASLQPADDGEEWSEFDLSPGDLLTGVLIGTVEITNCSEADGDYRWYLANPQRLDKPLTPKNHPQPAWFIPF
jgi:hypothetical protein